MNTAVSARHSFGIRSAWRLFTGSPIVFSVKVFAAGLLALYAALALGLDQPGWALATVYIVTQPLAGAVLAKSLYRFVGTLAGGLFILVAVPGLVDAPPLLILAFALWMGACLFLAIWDGTARAYAFILAGYTVAIVGFPLVQTPADVFSTVVWRVSEITLGIGCATLVSAVMLPLTARGEALAGLGRFLDALDAHLAGLLMGKAPVHGWCEEVRLLAASAADLDALARQARYEPLVSPAAHRSLQQAVARAWMMIPVLADVADQLAAVRKQDAIGLEQEAALAVLGRRLEAREIGTPEIGRPEIDETEIASGLAALSPDPVATGAAEADAASLWRRAAFDNLAARLRLLLDLRGDCTALLDAMMAVDPRQPRALCVPVSSLPRPASGLVLGTAVRATLGLVVGLLALGTFWLAAGWQDGGTAMAMVAALGGLTASQPDPLRAIGKFAEATVIAILLVFVYQFAILPGVQDFFSLALVLAPTLLVVGVMMARPASAALAMGLGANFCSLLGIQNGMGSDLVAFANSNSAFLIGMAVTAAIVAVLRPSAPRVEAGRLCRRGWRDVAALARSEDAAARTEIAWRFPPHLGLLARTRAAHIGEDTGCDILPALAALGVEGLTKVIVRGAEGLQLAALLALAADEASRRARGEGGDGASLAVAVDRLAEVAAAMPRGETDPGRDIMIALASLRRGFGIDDVARA